MGGGNPNLMISQPTLGSACRYMKRGKVVRASAMRGTVVQYVPVQWWTGTATPSTSSTSHAMHRQDARLNHI